MDQGRPFATAIAVKGDRIVGAAAVLLTGIGLFALTWILDTPGSVVAGMTQVDQNLAAAEPPRLEVGKLAAAE